VPVGTLPTDPPTALLMPYTKSMKKQPTKLDMSAIMADYTAKVNAEAKRREEILKAHAEGTYQAPDPATYGTWTVSDRD